MATDNHPRPPRPSRRRPRPRSSRRSSAGFNVGRALAWAFMILVILVSLFPFYWMLRTALSSNNALYAGSDSLLPVQPSWGGFERVFGLQTGQEAIDAGGAGQPINFWRYLLNSIVVATLITVGQVFFSAMAAYAFARLRWRHREKVFAFFLAGLMIPAIFTLLPNFVLIKQLGLVDTLLGIALPTHADDAVRGVLPAPVLPRHLPRGGGGGADRRRVEGPGVLPADPADVGGADRDAGDPHLHHRLERLLLAADGQLHRQLAGAHRRARACSSRRPRRPGRTGPG